MFRDRKCLPHLHRRLLGSCFLSHHSLGIQNFPILVTRPGILWLRSMPRQHMWSNFCKPSAPSSNLTPTILISSIPSRRSQVKVDPRIVRGRLTVSVESQRGMWLAYEFPEESSRQIRSYGVIYSVSGSQDSPESMVESKLHRTSGY